MTNRPAHKGLRAPRHAFAKSFSIALMLGAVSGAASGHPVSTAPAADDRPDAMYPLEVRALGQEHALEHLQQRNAERSQGVQAKKTKVPKIPPTPEPNGTADQVGRWGTPFIPPGSSPDAIGVHAILLHSGKVMLYGGYFDSSDNTLDTDAFLYNPVDGSAQEVDPPHNTFCSGQVLLQDGSLLVVGGRLDNTHPTPGTPYVLRFDPVSEIWLTEPDTPLGRYYPTTTELPDGRALITSGNMITGKLNRTVDVFTPGTGGAQGVMQTVLSNLVIDLYPKQYVMPDGRVLLIQHSLTSMLNPSNWTVQKLPSLTTPRKNNPGSFLMPAAPGQPEHKVFITGGALDQRGATSATSEVFDSDTPTAGWKPAASMPNPRTHMNIVYLPDGTLLGIGGNSYDRFDQPQASVLRYDPATDTWATFASQAMRRAYHSTALLLPDGRVLSAGDTGPGGGATVLEIYSPPYLFKSPRPVVTGVSADQFAYGDPITISTDTPVSRVVLIHPTSVTHANDMSGRFVELVATTNLDGSVTAAMPPDAILAQPGYWMMYVLSADNVPSVATWVHLGPLSFGG